MVNMFTIDEKSEIITALLTRRNVIETGNPYISLVDVLKRKEMGIVTKTKAEARALSNVEVDEVVKINKLIEKVLLLHLRPRTGLTNI